MAISPCDRELTAAQEAVMERFRDARLETLDWFTELVDEGTDLRGPGEDHEPLRALLANNLALLRKDLLELEVRCYGYEDLADFSSRRGPRGTTPAGRPK